MAALRLMSLMIGVLVAAGMIGLVFIIVARVSGLLWQSGSPTYNHHKSSKRKRTPAQRVILTDDGEVLDVVDENEPETLRGTHHG